MVFHIVYNVNIILFNALIDYYVNLKTISLITFNYWFITIKLLYRISTYIHQNECPQKYINTINKKKPIITIIFQVVFNAF